MGASTGRGCISGRLLAVNLVEFRTCQTSMSSVYSIMARDTGLINMLIINSLHAKKQNYRTDHRTT